MWMGLHLQYVWDIYKIPESTSLAMDAPHPTPNRDNYCHCIRIPLGPAAWAPAKMGDWTEEVLLGTAKCHVPILLLSICQPQPASWARLFWIPLTCFGCICKFRSTNGTMNRYVPVGKAQLKFFHRPLSSLV